MRIIKKLEGQRWFIWTIVFAVVSLSGLATYITYVSQKDANDVFITKLPSRNTSKFAGQWLWQDPKYTSIELSNGKKEFQAASLGLNLKVSDNKISGTWTSDFYDGKRIDGCSEDEKNRAHEAENTPCISGQLAGNTAEIVFLSGYDDTTGKTKLIYNSTDDTLTWEITQNPKGEFYAPGEAILKRINQSAQSIVKVENLINTVWVPDDGSDAFVAFLSTKNNDPKHAYYDYKIVADSRLQEIGYWEIKNNEIITIVTKVLATPQNISKITLNSQVFPRELYIFQRDEPDGFKLIENIGE